MQNLPSSDLEHSTRQDSCMAADPGEFFELEFTQTSIAMEESELLEKEPLDPIQVLYSMNVMYALRNATCLRVSFVC